MSPAVTYNGRLIPAVAAAAPCTNARVLEMLNNAQILMRARRDLPASSARTAETPRADSRGPIIPSNCQSGFVACAPVHAPIQAAQECAQWPRNRPRVRKLVADIAGNIVRSRSGHRQPCCRRGVDQHVRVIIHRHFPRISGPTGLHQSELLSGPANARTTKVYHWVRARHLRDRAARETSPARANCALDIDNRAPGTDAKRPLAGRVHRHGRMDHPTRGAC